MSDRKCRIDTAGREIRPFGGERGDLDFEFATNERVALVSAIIAACTTVPDERRALEQAILELSVGRRIARLLRVVAQTEETEALNVVLTCPLEACGRPFEVNLPFAELLEAEGSSPDAADHSLEVMLPRGATMRLRCPTGRDQQGWRTQSFSGSQDAMLHMVASLTTFTSDSGRRLDDEDVAVLAGAMEEVDPLTAFRVSTTCPHCGCELTTAVDLEAAALRRLERAQRALLRDVHRLATHYGWTEAEVAAVPPSRRSHYIRLIDALEPVQP